MVKALGIGGVFFRAKDPAALAAWYKTPLGIDPAPTGPGMMPWISEAGVTVFSPFPEGSDYFAADRHFMLNFRVADLDAALEELADAGIPASRHQDMEGVGRFARIHDPEGSPIELWEPAVAKHVRLLKEAGLVEERAQGRRRIYTLQAAPLSEVDAWLFPFRAFWAARLVELKALIEEEEATRERDQGPS